jgi:hypothetical protein
MQLALNHADEADLPIIAPNYSPGLHNVIIALGLAYAEEDYLRDTTTRNMFIKEADQRLEEELTRPCLATVQALALRTSFSSTAGEYAVAWLRNGLSVRLCYARE